MFEKLFRSFKPVRWGMLFLLALLFAFAPNGQVASAKPHEGISLENGTIPASTGVAIRLFGEVGARPENETGIGEWSIDIGPDWSRTIHIVERTDLPDRLPAVGQKVEIRGQLLVDRTVVASEIKKRSSNADFRLPSVIFEGIVTGSPAGGAKIGLWSILLRDSGDDSGDGESPPPPITLEIEATAETRFGGGIPKTGQKVKVWATLQETGMFVGNDIRLQERDEDDDEISFEGIVLSTSQRSDKVQRWVIESSERLYLVEADSETELKDGPPLRGQKVKVKGTQKLDGRVVADEITIADERNATRFSIVLFRPDTENHVGIWRMRDARGRNFAVKVDGETVFDAGVPEVGNFVVVFGLPRSDGGGGAVDAKVVHLSAANDEIKFEALILQSPDAADGTGEWRMGINRDLLIPVVADGETEFHPRIPAVSEWVEVQGHLGADGRILADKIELKSFEDDELVIRLNSDVVSGTIASRYNLIPHDTLLSSGNIFLFITPNSDEEIEDVIEQMKDDEDVIWTEPNYTSGVPVGNPYKTWKWGGTEETGYVNQKAFDQVNLTPAHTEYQGKIYPRI